jgi:U4/U6.U5 tri-snRNP-associated protein 1
MDVDQKPIVPRVRDLDTNFIDDDDLQAALARSRRAKLHKAKKHTPEELVRKSSFPISTIFQMFTHF